MKTELERAVINVVNQKTQPNKVILLVGARRVGKTKFIKNIFVIFLQIKF